MIFSGEEIVSQLIRLGITHVVWVPDSDMGQWERELDASALNLIRVCREGEAWPLAAGLLLGGERPMVVMQTTGLFESGDALRNIVHDLQLPIFALIGARNWLNADCGDSARHFAMPILQAWEMDFVLIEGPAQCQRLSEHYQACQAGKRAGAVLLAE